jgi:hypothetical protein
MVWVVSRDAKAFVGHAGAASCLRRHGSRWRIAWETTMGGGILGQLDGKAKVSTQ